MGPVGDANILLCSSLEANPLSCGEPALLRQDEQDHSFPLCEMKGT